MLTEVKAERRLRQRKHNSSHLQYIDPDFGEAYDDNKYGESLYSELTITRLTTVQRSVLTAFVNKYLHVFRKKGSYYTGQMLLV